jgi:hypothetical protein
MPMPVPVPFSLNYLADLAGLEWNERIDVEWTNSYPRQLDCLDPFFDSLGSFDAKAGRIQIYESRCVRSASLIKAHWPLIVRVAVIHFCARAVVLLGIHPQTGKSYINPANASMMFKTEPYPWRATHERYDASVRQELLFAQIFTYISIVMSDQPEEKRLFKLLSIGHADLYSLVPTRCIHPLLFRHWKSMIETDPMAAAREAANVLGVLTRGVAITRNGVTSDSTE